MEDGQNPLYHSNWDSNINPVTSIDQEIDELVEANKRFNKAVNKIQQYINNIIDVCKEYELDYEDFVEIKYDY
jgi:RNase adaptor protein for sRNA GlmZ degradation